MIRSHHLLYKKNVASRSLSAAATTFRSRLKQLTKRHGSRTPSALPRCCCRACAAMPMAQAHVGVNLSQRAAAHPTCFHGCCSSRCFGMLCNRDLASNNCALHMYPGHPTPALVPLQTLLAGGQREEWGGASRCSLRRRRPWLLFRAPLHPEPGPRRSRSRGRCLAPRPPGWRAGRSCDFGGPGRNYK